MKISGMFRHLFLMFSVLLLASCASQKVYQVDLLPPPDVFTEGLVNPFPEKHPLKNAPYNGILYATDRLPGRKTFLNVKPKDDDTYYKNKRGTLLRLGMAKIEIDRRKFITKEPASWQEIKEISLKEVREYTYPLQIKDIEEFGILDRSYTVLRFTADNVNKSVKPGKKFAGLINKKLAMSRKKDIYIYVHGYNTVFEDPLLVGAELWHYMGYDGVFIAYSWPATPRGLAYFADQDTARMTSRNLRIFLEFLSEETNVEEIHLIGYSMGTRVVTYAIKDSALIHKGKTHKQIRKKIRIGEVMLFGSDLDRGVVAGYLLDGLLNVPSNLNIYMSGDDGVLWASRWLFERRRLGENWADKKPPQVFVDYLKENPNLHFIDVTNAEDAASGKGHSYFTDSPWVSSDLLLTLMFGLSPEQRGLVRDQYNMWKFDKNHLTRLRSELEKLDPKLLDVNKR